MYNHHVIMKTDGHLALKNKPEKTRLPLIIAGPCSAESPVQLMETATALATTGKVDYFRAGVWKPRTAPGSFEGVGEKALQWLQQVKQNTGLQVCTEIATVQHVEKALEHGIDMLWIGARTVSNPFLVQELADTLRGTNVRVMVKNPMAPDLDLWAGSIKRFKNAGLEGVCAIHRGFFYWTKSLFRNHPWWHIPVTLKQRMPEIPIICDPSHIAGDQQLVELVARRGLEIGMDGLMIEVHSQPENALSDARQQITPAAFADLMNKLFGKHVTGKEANRSMLEELRVEVDVIDQVLIWALGNRMKLAGEIATIKTAHDMKTLQPRRWKQVIKKVLSRARDAGLRPAFVRKLFDEIHHESLSAQKTKHSTRPKKPGIPPIFEL